MMPSEQSPFLTLGLSQPEAKQSEPKLDMHKQIADWKLEPELACPIPRRIILRWSSLELYVVAAGLFALMFWLLFTAESESKLSLGSVLSGAVMFAVLTPLIFYFDRERELSKFLVSRGTATRGKICERRRIQIPRHGSDYDYGIAYNTPAKHYITSTVIYLSIGALRGAEVGDTFTVLYLPEAPEKAMLYKECHYKAVASQEKRSA